ncbi:Clavaminate synthase-like protein [Dendrothele bispora CBS 962.96]|uniref:Clavaminate synthase-like protein n=1 Tax=Dendrothele bispora (strain CBS 962.96) TaxID=1314807 RepID=A0A4S8KQ89_DENBC|nr:Clavaminate synthase-like protein [Dendrothele bispora CBS 962.96]
MPATTLPPFPDNVPTHPLLVVDYALLKEGDSEELDRLWTAATTLGFWYLKNHGVDSEVNEMFRMGEETMHLPLEEKMKFEQGDEGLSFGYKAAGANAVEASGLKDTVEFINIAKDDAFAWPQQARRSYPSTVNDRMPNTVTPFVKKSNEINDTLLGIFNTRLGLPDGTLTSLHSPDEYSASEARVIKSPASAAASMTKERMAIGAHTDFGSLSFLHNRLGGLQVLPPGITEWQYVKPLPGHAICNVGDALALFSGGILHSNIHRVVPPPGEQSKLNRCSLVYFTRPGNSVVLRALKDKSSLINEATQSSNNTTNDPEETAEQWFMRRIKNQRVKNITL